MSERLKGSEEKGGDSANGWESTKEVKFRQAEEKLEKTREERNATFEKAEKLMPWEDEKRADLMKEYDHLQKKADFQKEFKDQKAQEVRTEREWNIEMWGADIPDSQAQGAQGAENIYLENKKRRYDNAQKRIADIADLKEREKAKEQFEKKGYVWTESDDESLREASDVFGSEAAVAYGRAKEKHHRELAQIKRAHPFKFRKKAKEMGVTFQRKWDSPYTSLAQYRNLHFALEHLAPKAKGEKE